MELENYPHGGDVVYKGDEVIGTYTCDENDYHEFTPDGSKEAIFGGFHLGPFCGDIAEWQQKRESSYGEKSD